MIFLNKDYATRSYMFVFLQNLLTYLRSWALPEKLPIVQPLRNFPALENLLPHKNSVLLFNDAASSETI
jgi:hypothetical protein